MTMRAVVAAAIAWSTLESSVSESKSCELHTCTEVRCRMWSSLFLWSLLVTLLNTMTTYLECLHLRVKLHIQESEKERRRIFEQNATLFLNISLLIKGTFSAHLVSVRWISLIRLGTESIFAVIPKSSWNDSGWHNHSRFKSNGRFVGKHKRTRTVEDSLEVSLRLCLPSFFPSLSISLLSLSLSLFEDWG